MARKESYKMARKGREQQQRSDKTISSAHLGGLRDEAGICSGDVRVLELVGRQQRGGAVLEVSKN